MTPAELVARLREAMPEITGKSYYWGGLVKRAADMIEAQAREIERLREWERPANAKTDVKTAPESAEISGAALRACYPESPGNAIFSPSVPRKPPTESCGPHDHSENPGGGQ